MIRPGSVGTSSESGGLASLLWPWQVGQIGHQGTQRVVQTELAPKQSCGHHRGEHRQAWGCGAPWASRGRFTSTHRAWMGRACLPQLRPAGKGCRDGLGQAGPVTCHWLVPGVQGLAGFSQPLTSGLSEPSCAPECWLRTVPTHRGRLLAGPPQLLHSQSQQGRPLADGFSFSIPFIAHTTSPPQRAHCRLSSADL